ncbi:MAG: polysaccharide biosynthesis/export family protein [Kiritimatiellae bacterium]|nr:polysaccharide biosynthesis/export family protein [Kiritimatiellia bacterium]
MVGAGSRGVRAASAALAAAALAAALAGCYPKRWTTSYNKALNWDLENSNAVLETTGRDAETEKKRIEFLEALWNEQQPPYRVNAGDEIEIRVYGHDELNVTTRVSPDGCVGMMFLGQVEVAGRTIMEARDAVEKGLAPYIKHPVVGVTVLQVDSETITISGACARPGLYGISSSTRLADAYALAGGTATRLFHGITIDVADLEHSLLIRDGKILPVDFQRAIEHGDPLDNVLVRKSDYIFIAQRMESSVTVCGEIKSPQKRLYQAPMGLIETLTDCGWMLEDHWSHVIIIRDGLVDPKMYKVDVDGILAGKCQNVYLKPNDIVYIPKDTLSEYNVFVRKLFPTAQLIGVLRSEVTAFTGD